MGRTLLTSSLLPAGLMHRERCSSSQGTLEPVQLLEGSPLEHSPIRSRLLSGSQGFLSSVTPELTISPSPRLATPIFPSWPFATWTLQLSSSTLLFPATISLPSPLV